MDLVVHVPGSGPAVGSGWSGGVTVIIPKAQYDWMHERLQDFKTVSEYNFSLFKISS